MPIPRGYNAFNYYINAYNFMAQIMGIEEGQNAYINFMARMMGIEEGQNAYINFPAKTKDAVYSIENNDSGEKGNVMQ